MNTIAVCAAAAAAAAAVSHPFHLAFRIAPSVTHMKQPDGSAMPFPSPASLTLAATASVFAALLLRRRLRVRAALSEWSRVAAAHGLSNAPPHHVRVAITGERLLHACQSYMSSRAYHVSQVLPEVSVAPALISYPSEFHPLARSSCFSFAPALIPLAGILALILL